MEKHERWIVRIGTHLDKESRSGTWTANLSRAEEGGMESFPLSEDRERTNWDDLQLRAAIASLTELRKRGAVEVEFHSDTDYLYEGFERFEARQENGPVTLAGHKVRNWKLWERLKTATEGLKVTFVVNEPLHTAGEVQALLDIEDDVID